MRWKYKGLKTLTVMLVLTVVRTASAQNLLRLVIEQDTANPKIPASVVCPLITSGFVIEKIGDELGFADKRQPEKQIIQTKYLPKFDLKEAFSEGIFQITSLSDETKSCNFIVGAITKGTIESGLKKLEGSGKKALDSGPGWMVLEERPLSPAETEGVRSSMSPATLSTSDAGNLIRLYEDSSTYPKLLYPCARFYDPTGFTRNSFGIVTWGRDDPASNGYSIKDENSSSEYVSSLRCPKGANQSEYLADGVYRTLWDLLYGARALKVPDHCTAWIAVDSLNKRYWDCCCNAAASAAAAALGKETYCKWVDPRSLGGWPNAATKRCG